MRFLKYLLYLSPLIIFIVYTTVKEMQREELGTPSNPIKLYFTPSVDAKDITQSSTELIDFLEAETGYTFETAVPTSYIAVVEAFGSKKADIALVNTFSYLLAHEKYGATARLRVVRDNEATTYRGMVIVRTDSGIDSLSELNGKKIAYVDPASTSGYILPKALLDEKGIKPSEEVFAQKHDNVVTMVYQKQVDVGAAFYSEPDRITGKVLDARSRVMTQFPDVVEQVKIIALTDPIPNDPLMFRGDLPEKIIDKVTNAILKFISTPKGLETMYRIYSVKGFVPTADKDFDVLRDMLKKINFNLEESVK